MNDTRLRQAVSGTGLVVSLSPPWAAILAVPMLLVLALAIGVYAYAQVGLNTVGTLPANIVGYSLGMTALAVAVQLDARAVVLELQRSGAAVAGDDRRVVIGMHVGHALRRVVVVEELHRQLAQRPVGMEILLL